MMKVLLAALIGFGFWAVPEHIAFAAGYTAVCGPPGTSSEGSCIKPNADGSINAGAEFVPTGSASLSVSITTSNVALPTTDPVLIIQNTGAVNAFFALGVGNGTTATTSSYSLPAGNWISVAVGSNTYLAGITASGSTTFQLIQGTGSPTVAAGGSGGGSSLSATATTAAPSYVNNTSNPLSMDLSGNTRVIIPSSQLTPTGTAGGLSSANISTGVLPLNASGDPYTQATLNITSATTTTVVSGTAAQTVRIYAIVLTCAAAQTIDIQSTGGTSRTGGALTCAASGSIVLDPFPTGSARYTSVSGEGIQFVTSTSGTVRGTVYYIKS